MCIDGRWVDPATARSICVRIQIDDSRAAWPQYDSGSKQTVLGSPPLPK
jgi:hypothetical protein